MTAAKQTLALHGYLGVPSTLSTRGCYRVRWADVVVMRFEDGRPIARLRALAAGLLPPADLLHYCLRLLTSAEERFLAMARREKV